MIKKSSTQIKNRQKIIFKYLLSIIYKNIDDLLSLYKSIIYRSIHSPQAKPKINSLNT